MRALCYYLGSTYMWGRADKILWLLFLTMFFAFQNLVGGILRFMRRL